MPKVLRIVNRFNLGGPTYNAAYLTQLLAPEFETILVGGVKEDSEADSLHILDGLGIKPVIIPEMKRAVDPKSDRIAYKKLKKIIDEFKPDIVHTHAAKAGALGRLAAQACGVPVVLHTFHGHVFHSYFNPIKTKVFKSIERYLAKKSSRIVAISDLQKEELCNQHKITSLEKCEVVPLGFDLSRFQENLSDKRKQFRASYNIADDEIALGIVGRLVPVKDHSFFFKAVKEVFDKTEKKLRVFVVGDGELREQLLNEVKDLGLSSCVDGFENSKAQITFTSWIKEVDVVYAGVDIVALSSLNEGTPVSLIEAQAANKAVISTEVGGIGNVVEHEKTGLLSEPGDVEGYAKNLLSLLDDKQLLEKLSGNGWEHVNQKFSAQRLVNDVSTLYYRLLEEKSL